jgi:hypothetical protein
MLRFPPFAWAHGRAPRWPAALPIAATLAMIVSCAGGLDNPAAPTSPGVAAGAGTAPVSARQGHGETRGQTQVDICHRTEGVNDFVLLSVASSAVDAHSRHGDARVGQPVPGRPGMIFGIDCTPLPVGPMLDQSNITYLSFGGDGAPGSAVTPGQSVAQIFTAGISGLLTSVDLGIYREAGAIGDVTLDILPFSVFPAFDLSPSLFSMTIPLDGIPLLTTTLTSVDVSGANLLVSAGDQLAVVLRRSAGSFTSPWVVWQDSDPTSPYPGGGAFVHHPGFAQWLSVSGDYRFQTWVNP